MLQLVAIGIATATAGGCATGIPLPSLMAKTSSTEDVTGSIRGTSPLSNTLDQEDWRRAKGAMGLALDPQGNGSPVTWENPQSKARGSFTPVGQAKAVDDKICRAFIAELGGSLKSEQLQGDACRDRSGEWNVGKVQPWKQI
jgi:surface antigen